MLNQLTRPKTYSLDENECTLLKEVCSIPQEESIPTQETIVNMSAPVAASILNLMPTLCNEIRSLNNDTVSPGLLILKNLPSVADPRLLICTVGSLLGEVAKFSGEGDYVIEIRERETKAGQRPSFSNAREFFLHTDLSYVNDPPRFLLMHSIFNDPNSGGFSIFCDIEEALQNLSSNAVAELQKDQFEFPAPPHYRGTSYVRYPILAREEDDAFWKVRFRRDNIHVLSNNGMGALAELVHEFRKKIFEVTLLPNTMAIIDNWSFLHGRTAFTKPGSTNQFRWLNRTYANPVS